MPPPSWKDRRKSRKRGSWSRFSPPLPPRLPSRRAAWNRRSDSQAISASRNGFTIRFRGLARPAAALDLGVEWLNARGHHVGILLGGPDVDPVRARFARASANGKVDWVRSSPSAADR